MTREELENKLDAEKEHSAFLEKLLKALYGEGWNKLTLYEANKWREQTFIKKEPR